MGGVVEKFIGDAVMAVWGTPLAAEGDAERAVRAALDLVAAVAQVGAEAVPGRHEVALCEIVRVAGDAWASYTGLACRYAGLTRTYP